MQRIPTTAVVPNLGDAECPDNGVPVDAEPSATTTNRIGCAGEDVDSPLAPGCTDENMESS